MAPPANETKKIEGQKNGKNGPLYRTAGENTLTEMQGKLDDIAHESASAKEHCKGMIEIVKDRQGAVQAVLAPNMAKIKEYIQRF